MALSGMELGEAKGDPKSRADSYLAIIQLCATDGEHWKNEDDSGVDSTPAVSWMTAG